MKRGAERQLTKDELPDDEVEEVLSPGAAFKKADEGVLATRQMRGLPKRSSRSPAPTPPTNGTSDALPTPKFASFTGFGERAPGTNPFSFTAPISTASQPLPPSQTKSVFGSSGNPSEPPSSTNGPLVASSASPATKTFASMLGANSLLEPPSAKVDAILEEPDASSLTYYTSLRGLNVSMLSALTTAVEQDPFIDVANILERYKSLRLSVQQKFDEKPKPAIPETSKQPTSRPPIISGAEKSQSTAGTLFTDAPKTAVNPPAMPTPPATFTGFNIPPSSSFAPTGGGFIPQLSSKPPTSSGFSFSHDPPSTSSSSNTLKSAFSFIPSDASSNAIAPSAETAMSETAAKPSLTFGTPSSTFGTSSPFGSSNFGASSSSPFAFGAPSSSENEKKTETADTKNIFGTPEKTPAPISFGGFGSGAASKPNLFSGFGKTPGGSIGNPVGFGFGSPPKTTDNTDVPSLLAPKSAFSFGAPPPKSTEGVTSPTEENRDDSQTPEEADLTKLLPNHQHDEEGEGEEGEETTHSIKAKVFKMVRDKEGKSKWGDMGVGVLRLKKHKETDARRILLRNSGTGKITINFKIYAGLNPTVSTRHVSFVGHEEDGTSSTFKLRLKTDDQAAELKDALDREIAFVNGK